MHYGRRIRRGWKVGGGLEIGGKGLGWGGVSADRLVTDWMPLVGWEWKVARWKRAGEWEWGSANGPFGKPLLEDCDASSFRMSLRSVELLFIQIKSGQYERIDCHTPADEVSQCLLLSARSSGVRTVNLINVLEARQRNSLVLLMNLTMKLRGNIREWFERHALRYLGMGKSSLIYKYGGTWGTPIDSPTFEQSWRMDMKMENIKRLGSLVTATFLSRRFPPRKVTHTYAWSTKGGPPLWLVSWLLGR